MFYVYGLIAWFALLISAIINGTVRDFCYPKKIKKLQAHRISTFTLVFLINLVTYLFLKITNATPSKKELWILGLGWLIMTLAFEFLFFHYIGKHSWKELFDQYNLKKGKIWILVLIATLLAPILMNNLI